MQVPGLLIGDEFAENGAIRRMRSVEYIGINYRVIERYRIIGWGLLFPRSGNFYLLVYLLLRVNLLPF